MILLAGSHAGAQLRMKHFSTRSAPPDPYLEDFRANFFFDYPADWSIESPVSGRDMFVTTGKATPTSIEMLFTVGPLRVSPQADPALTMALTKQVAAEFETRSYARAASHSKSFEGETVFNGLRAYEIHSSAVRAGQGGEMMISRTIFILPNDTIAGLVLLFSATVGTDDLRTSAELGEKGDLARIAKSFQVLADHKPADSIRTFVNRKEKTIPDMLATYFGFSFPYRRSWQLSTGTSNPGMFASVRRGIERGGIPNFSTDHFTVGGYDLGVKPGDPASSIPSLTEISAEVEKGIAAGFSTYKKASQGSTTMGGVTGYEFRYSGTLPSPNAKGVSYYGRVVILPSPVPGRGAIITMITTSLSRDVKGPADVGEKGELGEVVRGFVMEK